jgi:hypothetical protein
MIPLQFKERVNEISKAAREKQLSIKLLDGIQTLYSNRLESSRRWIWELIQNACDASSADGIYLTIKITMDQLVFSHNGRPFTVEEILYLIEQTSSKERRDFQNCPNQLNPPSMGRYGTGFLTTHLLSKKVEIKGIVQDKQDSQKRNFTLHLDRSETTIEGMLRSVRRSLDVFDDLDNPLKSPPVTAKMNPLSPTTYFCYSLNTGESIDVVENGIKHFLSNLKYVLAFNPKIKQVTIDKNGKIDTFECKDKVKFLTGDLFSISNGSNDKVIFIYTMKEGDTTLAVELEQLESSFAVCSKEKDVPAIFVNFPLTGQNEFQLPFVINSQHFQPNEQRSKIVLQSGSTAKCNKNYMEMAFKILIPFFNSLNKEEIENVHFLVNFTIPRESDDKGWLDEKIKVIRNNVYDKLLFRDNSGQKVPFKDLQIFRHKDLETTIRLYEIMKPVMPPRFPLLQRKYFALWIKLVDDFSSDFNRNHLKSIEDLLGHIESFKDVNSLTLLTGDVFGMLNKFYEMVQNEVTFSNWKIFPNQNGLLCAKSLLYGDKIVDDDLKDIALQLGQDFRSKLIHPSIKFELTQFLFIHDITKMINNSIKPGDNKIVKTLSLLCPSDAIAAVARQPITNLLNIISPKYKVKVIEHWEDSIWAVSDKLMVLKVIDIIENLDITKNVGISASNVLKVVTHLLTHFKIDCYSKKIYPNVHGKFFLLADLSKNEVGNELTKTFEDNASKIEDLLFKIRTIIIEDPHNFLIDPIILSLISPQSDFKLSKILYEIGNFLKNKNSYGHAMFSTIFKYLKELEEKYGFTQISEYIDNKKEMFYFVIDEKKKNFILENVEQANFVDKCSMVIGMEVEEIQKALDWRTKIEKYPQIISIIEDFNLESEKEPCCDALKLELDIQPISNRHIYNSNIARTQAGNSQKVEFGINLETNDLVGDNPCEDSSVKAFKDESEDINETNNLAPGRQLTIKDPRSHQREKFRRLESLKRQTNSTNFENISARPSDDNPFDIPPADYLPEELIDNPLSKREIIATSIVQMVPISCQREKNTPICFSQGEIDQAVLNTIAFLKAKEKYNFNKMAIMKTKNSNILTNVTYKRQMTNIIIRPSKLGISVLINQDEIDVLKDENSQMWLDNGIDEPYRFHFGEFLESNWSLGKEFYIDK